MESHRVNSIISGRSPPFILYTYINSRVETPKQKQETISDYHFWTKSSVLRYSNIVRDVKDLKFTTWLLRYIYESRCLKV